MFTRTETYVGSVCTQVVDLSGSNIVTTDGAGKILSTRPATTAELAAPPPATYRANVDPAKLATALSAAASPAPTVFTLQAALLALTAAIITTS